MNICGIISEYNPFHYGHRYHINKTKELTHCDVLINVMSGHFVQRGEPAIADKWNRAKTAILEGCDLVIELPFPYAVQSADGFAYGAITSLQLADANQIVFGSESNDIATLKASAETTTPKNCTRSMAQDYDVKSNDILGVAYIKALKNTNIIPYTIQRTNGYHDLEVQNHIASATAIRHRFLHKESIKELTPMYEQLNERFQMEFYYPHLQMLLLTMEPSVLSHYFLMEEGLENRMIESAKLCPDMKSFVDRCISKRYTRARIQRTIIHLITQTSKQQMKELPQLSHIRILAFNQTGRAYLKELKKKDRWIASKFNQIPECYRCLDLKAVAAYGIPLTPTQRLTLLKKELSAPLVVNV